MCGYLQTESAVFSALAVTNSVSILGGLVGSSGSRSSQDPKKPIPRPKPLESS